MPEIHLFIIWSKALDKKTDILKDISSKFEVLETYNVTWSKDKFSENLSRFYGENLPKNSFKEKHCGNDTFTCVIVKDNKPNYEVRETSKGAKVVDINLFDAKQLYRSWTGGGHKIHATDNSEEVRLQLVMLFNKTYNYYLNKEENKLEKDYRKDLVGADGWNSLEEVFNILNETLNYIILRNFETLEDELDALHPDIDLLVENKTLAINILNAKATTDKAYRVQYDVLIDNKNINFDLRHIGDNYYCEKWERELISTRIKENYFFRPDENNYFYSLAYHALLHKQYISKDYIMRLIEISKSFQLNIDKTNFIEAGMLDILSGFMDQNNYSYVEPDDLTVYWNDTYLLKKLKTKVSLKRKYYNNYIYLKQITKQKIKRIKQIIVQKVR